MSPDVAILLDRFGPGGVERVACHVANGLQRRGLSVEIVVLEDAGPARELLDPGVPVRVLATVPRLSRRHRLKAAVPAIAAYLRRSRPRIFHSPGNHITRPAALGIALAGYRGAFVSKITNPPLADGKTLQRRWLRRAVYAWALRKARVVLALSPAAVDQIIEIDGRLADRTRVIHNPYVSARMIGSAIRRSPADPPVILSVGRLSAQKNHALLLRAAARLDHKRWRLRICGAGPEEGAIRALSRDLDIANRVDLPGYSSDLVPEYLAATVMALPSRWEGLPATVLEAVACGCPVVSTASSPGLVDLLREIGAREPVALEDEAALAEALRTALDGQLPRVDPDLSLPYSIEAACDEHALLFSEILGHRFADAGGNRTQF